MSRWERGKRPRHAGPGQSWPRTPRLTCSRSIFGLPLDTPLLPWLAWLSGRPLHLRTLGTSSRRPFPPRTLGTSSRRSSRRPFPPRTLRISGKKRASQQRESQVSCALQHKQLHALAVLSRCWPAQSKTACTHPYGGFSLLGLFVSLEKSEPVNGETATVSCTRRAAGAGRPARWPSCTLAVLHGQRARVTNHEDYED